MKQISAVEWLAKEIQEQLNMFFPDATLYQPTIEQAKEMEREQIVEGFNFGVYDGGALIKKYKMSGEQYYNETFKSE
jgi:hypothetical protein